jgi:hypothetical protein
MSHLPRHLTVIKLVQGVSLQQAELLSSATSSVSNTLYDITVHTAWCWKLEYYESSRLNFVTNKIRPRHAQLFNTYFLTFTHISINQDHLEEDTATESKCCCQALHSMICIQQNSHKYVYPRPSFILSCSVSIRNFLSRSKKMYSKSFVVSFLCSIKIK